MIGFRRLCVLMLVLAAGHALAAPPPAATLPPWEQLTPAQRELLVAPIRERWNANAQTRTQLLEHAQRWQQLTPQQRARAHHGMRRWEHMEPRQREDMRALFHTMRDMNPEQRRVLRERWHVMTAQQRRAWVEANPPAGD